MRRCSSMSSRTGIRTFTIADTQPTGCGSCRYMVSMILTFGMKIFDACVAYEIKISRSTEAAPAKSRPNYEYKMAPGAGRQAVSVHVR